MAAKQRKPISMSTSKRRYNRGAMMPVVSSDIMGNRNVEIVPVGAWVEPATDDFQPDAVISAQIEEEKIRLMQEEKENRLRSFQHQVKQRVSQASRVKRQQQIQEAEHAFQLERKVVQQSCLTADNARKDTCQHRQDLDIAIRNRLMQKYGDTSTWEKDREPPFSTHSDVNPNVMNKARQQLMSKKLHDQAEESASVTKPWAGRVTTDIQVPKVKSHNPIDNLKSLNKNNLKEDRKSHEDKENEESLHDQASDEELCNEDDEATGDRRAGSQLSVKFDDKVQVSSAHKRRKKPGSAGRPTSARMHALMSQESESDIIARQRRQQAAVSRRVFMDREREAVREGIRRQQHRKKIVSLKKEKEQWREELESMAHRELEPLDPDTGETEQERKLREKLEALEVNDMVNQRKELIKRQREMERYLSALKHSLLEKVTRRGTQLPALCACGDSVWDTHPETCANNCFFYRNHRAYARALQSLLSSADVM